MEGKYEPRKIEKKWQGFWEKEELFQAKEKGKKCYCLIEFPYPSSDGLHVGHLRSYTAIDIIARKRRMEGFDILFPIGFDAFGLPTENYAIKVKRNPKDITRENIETFTRQLKAMGFSFDWSRVVNTSDPKYYKWTQWIFLQLYKAGLVYQKEMPINWCPSCKIGLANEEVVAGKCERCETPVTKKKLKQWLFRITDYASRLIDDLDKVDFLEKIKTQQVNWIGRSEGANVKFKIQSTKSKTNSKSKIQNSKLFIEVFTTRPDTLYGVTYMVLSPEHELIEKLKGKIENYNEVKKYIEKASHKTDLERTESKEKTGVELKGVKAVNPVNNKEIPIFVADYVLISYGTGAIMAVPGHDERDFEFAKKYKLPIITVIEPITGTPKKNEEFRRSIVALVRNPKSGKLLSINWGDKLGGNLFIGGGLEKGEDPVECAKHEISEETGYKNLKFISQSEKIHHHYRAYSKKIDREIEAIGLYFELENEEKGRKNLKPDKKFKVEWITESEAEQKVYCPLHKYIFNKFIKGLIFTGEGIAVNSGDYNRLTTAEFKKKVTNWLEKNNSGEASVNYKLRDWIFSRQHYWGEPIPLIYCNKCGVQPIPEKDLPVELPEVKNYEPTDTGESPLAKISDWVNVNCPKCGGKAKRETDTMPNWAGSNWYFIRYCDSANDKKFADMKKMKHWLPVDLYNGGMEHTTLHLLYSRFWYKALYDLKLVPGPEPYQKRTSQGMVLAEDGRKMSKSFNNVVNPDDIIDKFGADAVRLYEMFMGPFDQAINWSTDGLRGMRRFLDKVWRLFERRKEGEVKNTLHKTIKKVTEDIESLRFNTTISQLMILVNEMIERGTNNEALEKFLIILSPFAPHLAEELWHKPGRTESVFKEKWPSYDHKLVKEEEIEFVVQVNGRVRDRLKLPADISEEEAKEKTMLSEKVKKYVRAEPKKVIFVKGKLINFVV